MDDGRRTVYYMEILNSKRVTDTLPALLRILARIESQHRCKAVFRVHADRAQEFTGDRIGAALAERCIRVPYMAGVDPNANGRGERGVRWLKEKARTYLSTRMNPKGPMVEKKETTLAFCYSTCNRGSTSRAIW